MNLAVSQPIPSICDMDNSVSTSALISFAKFSPWNNVIASPMPDPALPIANATRPSPKPSMALKNAPLSPIRFLAPPSSFEIDNNVITSFFIFSAQSPSFVNISTPAESPEATAEAP